MAKMLLFFYLISSLSLPVCQENVVIPEGTTIINKQVYFNCSKLINLTLPSTLRTISQGAFQYCTNFLGPLKIPDNVITIENFAFEHCEKLTSLTLGKNVKTIGNYAFAICYDINVDLIIPDSVSNIGIYSFISCTLITSVTLSKNLKIIPESAFSRCSNIKGEIIIPDLVTVIGIHAFYSCFNLSTIKFNCKLEKIGEIAFQYCYELKGPVIIPSSVNEIGPNVFQFSKVKEIFFEGTIEPSCSLAFPDDDINLIKSYVNNNYVGKTFCKLKIYEFQSSSDEFSSTEIEPSTDIIESSSEDIETSSGSFESSFENVESESDSIEKGSSETVSDSISIESSEEITSSSDEILSNTEKVECESESITIRLEEIESSSDETESSSDETESSSDETESSSDETESSSDVIESSSDETESEADSNNSSTEEIINNSEKVESCSEKVENFISVTYDSSISIDASSFYTKESTSITEPSSQEADNFSNHVFSSSESDEIEIPSTPAADSSNFENIEELIVENINTTSETIEITKNGYLSREENEFEFTEKAIRTSTKTLKMMTFLRNTIIITERKDSQLPFTLYFSASSEGSVIEVDKSVTKSTIGISSNYSPTVILAKSDIPINFLNNISKGYVTIHIQKNHDFHQISRFNLNEAQNLRGSLIITVPASIRIVSFISLSMHRKSSLMILRNETFYRTKSIKAGINNSVTILIRELITLSSNSEVTLYDANIFGELKIYDDSNLVLIGNSNVANDSKFIIILQRIGSYFLKFPIIFFKDKFNSIPSNIILSRGRNIKQIDIKNFAIVGSSIFPRCSELGERISIDNKKKEAISFECSDEEEMRILSVDAREKKREKLSAGAIAGIVIGCSLAVIIFISVFIYLIKVNDRSYSSKDEDELTSTS